MVDVDVSCGIGWEPILELDNRSEESKLDIHYRKRDGFVTLRLPRSAFCAFAA